MSFLSSMLPAIIGAGAVAATGGAAAPWVAGGLGALQAKRTGSLQKGIMAGLGAYGGGQLASGLLEAGATDAALNSVPQTAGMTGSGAQTIANNYGMMDPGATVGNIQGQATQDYAKNFLNAKDAAMNGGFQQNLSTMGNGLSAAYNNPSTFGLSMAKDVGMAAAPAIGEAMTPQPINNTAAAVDSNRGQRYSYSPGASTPMPAPDVPDYQHLGQDFGRPQKYFSPSYTKIDDAQAKSMYGFADGGILSEAGGGPVEQMSNQAAIGANTQYPMANMNTSAFATPYQDPRSNSMMSTSGGVPSGGVAVNQNTGELNPQGTRLAWGGIAEAARQVSGNGGSTAGVPEGYTYDPDTQQYKKLATGGIADAHYNLGGYSDGGRLLKGPGDGVSDSIPAMIGHKQPARLADGEFVVPARIVSELGNGSTEAGARRLYAMMDRVQQARGKTTGKKQVAKNTNAEKYLPA